MENAKLGCPEENRRRGDREAPFVCKFFHSELYETPRAQGRNSFGLMSQTSRRRKSVDGTARATTLTSSQVCTFLRDSLPRPSPL